MISGFDGLRATLVSLEFQRWSPNEELIRSLITLENKLTMERVIPFSKIYVGMS